MGFGPLFLGLMFLFDAQAGLRTGDGSVYMMIDLFPDVLGWLLMFRGLVTLSRKAPSFEKLKKPAGFLGLLSVFSLAKDTVLYSRFYTAAGIQKTPGEIFDFCDHLLILAFIYFLFKKMVPLARKYGEDKLAVHHRTIPTVVVAEGVCFVLAKILPLIPAEEFAKAGLVVSRLDYLFWIFLIWFAVITMVRSMLRISD